MKKKVLIFAEGATLAHVARPTMLVQSLDLTQFDPVLCRPREFSKITDAATSRVLDLDCQESVVFARRLDKGLPLYDFSTLCKYVETDLALIDAEHPDVIVGDFRLSLSVSARLRAVPYISICDAYWSPEYPQKAYLPVMKGTAYVPLTLAEFLFNLLHRLAFRLHASPLERLRAKYKLPSLGYDLRRCYTDADLRLFANIPELFPEVEVGEDADFIGPIAWSPTFDGNLEFLSGEGPLVYVSMGSSGDVRVVDTIIPVLEELNCRVIVTSAGQPISCVERKPSTKIYDFLPGDVVCRHASLVICNGGSPSTNQALTNGVPVLGIVKNMDQFLNMEGIVTFGAGLMLRSDRASSVAIRDAVSRLMGRPEFLSRARLLFRSSQDHIGNILATMIVRLASSFRK